MIVLGISAYYHDSSAVLVVDGEIAYAAQEERFTRKKHDPAFPLNSVLGCLSSTRKADGSFITLNDIDAVVFYDKPLLKFERLLETYYSFAPKGLSQFLASMPVWINEKMFLKKLIYSELRKIGSFEKSKLKLLFSEHHLSHAASAFFPSPFDEAAILTIDGVGEWATASISHGCGNEIKILKELCFPHSLGLLYSAFTYYAGFKVNSGEYKLMGLAPYGDPSSNRVATIKEKIYSNLIEVKNDGSLWLNQEYFDYAFGLSMVNENKWAKLFGFPKREPEGLLTEEYCDMALAIQKVTEDVVIKMAAEAGHLTGATNLCMAGGVALNCVANGILKKTKIFDDIWIQPAAGDAGGALGAAMSAYYTYFDNARKPAPPESADFMKGSYLGPSYKAFEIEAMAHQYNAPFVKYEEGMIFDEVAKLLAEGNVVGWFQGRMEFGPRALGNRSIIADARNKDMQKKLNLKIKFREGFRPFAPSVLAEDASQFFEDGYSSPYMLLIDYVIKDRRNQLPEGYPAMDLLQKLSHIRSDIPSVTHLDYSARVQTVHNETNPAYHALISAFKKRTGYGIIVNTSFNVRGEPVVNTPEDAYKCFMRTDMDFLVLENYIFTKTKQPLWKEATDWKTEYELD